MPQAILAILPYVAAAIGASETVVAVVAIVAAVASVALTAQEQRAQQNAAKRRARTYPRNATIRSTTMPRTIVYGKAQVGGPLVYANTCHTAGSTNNTDLWIVQAVAGHEVAAMEDVWVDDKRTTNAQITSGAGGPVLAGSPFYDNSEAAAFFYRQFGTSTQNVLAELQTAFPIDITSNFRGRGVAYIVCRFVLASNGHKLFTGVPANIRVLVKGKKVYDPRKDPTQASYGGSGSHSLTNSATWEWSDNPALCLADYLMDPRLGMRVANTAIDWSLVASSADYCDVVVTIPGGTEKRFTCNGVLIANQTHEDNVRAILSSMNGSLTWSGGKFRIKAHMWTAAVGSIGDGEFGAVLKYRATNTKGARADSYNTVRATIYDKDREYQEMDAGEMSQVP